MNNAQFAKEMLYLLPKTDSDIVLKYAATKGLTIDGFKNVTKAPLPSIAAKLDSDVKRKKKEAPWLIFLKSIVESELEESTIKSLTKRWLDSDAEHDEVEEELKEYKKSHSSVSKSKSKQAEKITTISDDQTVKDTERQLQNVINTLREKNKKLQNDILGFKIQIEKKENEIELKEKEFKILQQDYQKELDINNHLINNNTELAADKKRLVSEIAALNMRIEELSQSLAKFKSSRVKVLCICKTKINTTELIKYDITQMTNWDETLITDQYLNNFDEIWLVTRKFTYETINKILGRVNKGILKQFSTVNQLNNL